MHCFQTVEAGGNFIYTIMIKYNHHISAEQPFHLPYHFHLSIDPLHDESFALKQIITKQHSAFIFTLLIAQQIYPTFAICFQALQCNLGNHNAIFSEKVKLKFRNFEIFSMASDTIGKCLIMVYM